MLLVLPGTARAADIVASGECGKDGGNVTWTLDSEGTLTISGTGEMADYEYGSSPWNDRNWDILRGEIQHGVTSIGSSAFSECNRLTDVYYGGGEAEWYSIAIADYNEPLLNATIHFAAPEPVPEESVVFQGSWNGHFYEVYEAGKTWPEAESYCAAKGGHLACITSEEEQQFIERLIVNGSKQQYWLGLFASGDAFSWVTGENLSYTNWDAGQPDRSGREDGQNEDYVHILNEANPNVDGSEKFFWNDIFYDNTFPYEEYFFSLEHIGFICEYDHDIRKEALASITDAEVKLTKTSYPYTGKAIKPTVTVKLDGKRLKKNIDYRVTYQHNTAIGTATVTVTGKGGYTGTASTTFEIIDALKPIDSAVVTVPKKSYPFTGSAVKPTVTVKLDGKRLKKGTDYTVKYANNTKVGTATVTVTGKGDYTGTVSIDYEITSPLISIDGAAVTVAKKSYPYTGKAIRPIVTVKLDGKRLKKGTDYTVRYADNTKTGTATVTVKGKGRYTGTAQTTFQIVE